MNLVKDTLKLVQHEASKKANSAIEMKHQQPENADFWQGQFQAFNEMVTMLENMQNIH